MKAANQLCFGKFLFHLIEVAVIIDFAHKKYLFFTGFAHRKFVLWKSGGLDLCSGWGLVGPGSREAEKSFRLCEIAPFQNLEGGVRV
jgi:hypothetical protein